MSKGNTFENQFLDFIYGNVDIPWEAAAVNMELHLHTADPGEAGNSTTSECAYGSYAPVAIARGAGFTISGNQVQNAALVQFPSCTGGSEVATHWSLTPAGSTTIIHKGSLTASLSISSGIQPQFAPNSLTITED